MSWQKEAAAMWIKFFVLKNYVENLAKFMVFKKKRLTHMGAYTIIFKSDIVHKYQTKAPARYFTIKQTVEAGNDVAGTSA